MFIYTEPPDTGAMPLPPKFPHPDILQFDYNAQMAEPTIKMRRISGGWLGYRHTLPELNQIWA